MQKRPSLVSEARPFRPRRWRMRSTPAEGTRGISPPDWQPSVRPDEWTLAGQNLKRASSSKFPKNVLRKQRNRQMECRIRRKMRRFGTHSSQISGCN